MHYDILLLGDYFFDTIYNGLDQMPVLGHETYATNLTATGGAMFITAVAMQRLGVQVGWATHFGNDYYSRLNSPRVFTIGISSNRPEALASFQISYGA